MRTRTAQGRRSVWFTVVEPGTAIALGGFASQLSGLAFLHLFSVCRVGIRLASPGACHQASSAVKMPASLLAMHRKRTARMRVVPVSTGPADMPALLVGRSSIAIIQRKIRHARGRFAQ